MREVYNIFVAGKQKRGKKYSENHGRVSLKRRRGLHENNSNRRNL